MENILASNHSFTTDKMVRGFWISVFFPLQVTLLAFAPLLRLILIACLSTVFVSRKSELGC